MTAPFEGFRTGARASTLPAQFFTEVLPEIDDAAELRVTLYALYAITRAGRPLLAMRASELAHEEPLARLFVDRGGAATVRRCLDAAAARGVQGLVGGIPRHFVRGARVCWRRVARVGAARARGGAGRGFTFCAVPLSFYAL